MTVQAIKSPELKRRKETVEKSKPMVHPLLIEHVSVILNWFFKCKDNNLLVEKKIRVWVG